MEKRSKIVHKTNLKSFKEKELEICALTVIAEEECEQEQEVLHV